jgi:hypothetical protein
LILVFAQPLLETINIETSTGPLFARFLHEYYMRKPIFSFFPKIHPGRAWKVDIMIKKTWHAS